ncbi:hypothetical protein WICMUC_001568 [Wickerhamomyces mucosus]|uniref:Protein kinase domain-containing protein n=1 Tax=Wickerhamomyces mucosus TaxID=1378264 RepID=A0A9P8TH10_9ASCO|nr:hypothetical protein WICMUC_001568 [Wickerhamomyces mucosus]
MVSHSNNYFSNEANLMLGHEAYHPHQKKVRIPPDIDDPPYFLPLRPLKGNYRLISTLGTGSFGSVTLAKCSVSLKDSANFRIFKNTLIERGLNYSNENSPNKRFGLVAIKSISERLTTLNAYTKVNEVRFILKIPYHENLVQVYEMFIDSTSYKLHIVMECMDINLHQLMKSRKNNHFSLPTLKSILSQVLNGIRHIHRFNYFHRDVKPENILISPSTRFYDQEYLRSGSSQCHDNFVVKIADYGLAREVKNRRAYTSYISTRWYRAPEILLRKGWYSKPVDIWAFGSVAAEVALFAPLFPGSNELDQTYRMLDVLGTPISKNEFNSEYYPSYGYWDEAAFLSRDLGLNLPVTKCIDIQNIITAPELTQLCDVIRLCLTWNPNERPNAEKICSMPYFEGTCVDNYGENIDPNYFKPSFIASSDMYTSKSALNPIRFTYSSNFEKSEKLAGIPPIRKVNHGLQLKIEENQKQNEQEIFSSSVVGSNNNDCWFSDHKNYSFQETNTMALDLTDEILINNSSAVNLNQPSNDNPYFNNIYNNVIDFPDSQTFQQVLLKDEDSRLVEFSNQENGFNSMLNLKDISSDKSIENLKLVPSYLYSNSNSSTNFNLPGQYNERGNFHQEDSIANFGAFHTYTESNIRNIKKLDEIINEQNHSEGDITKQLKHDEVDVENFGDLFIEREFYDKDSRTRGSSLLSCTSQNLHQNHENDLIEILPSSGLKEFLPYEPKQNSKFTEQLYSRFQFPPLN